MKHLRLIVAFVLLFGLLLGRGGKCDVYVANAGAGSCVFVLFSAEGKERGLWVDCGFGCRGAVPKSFPSESSEKWNGVVGGFFFGKKSPWQKAKVKGETMLWITHLHEDHISQILQINRDDYIKENEKEEKVNAGSIIVSVGGGKEGLPRDIERARKQAKKSRRRKQAEGNLPEDSVVRRDLVDEILSSSIGDDNIQKVKIWGRESQSAEGDISKVVSNFWGDFPHEHIALKPLIPSGEYGKRKGNLDANDTSLVLALEYYGVKMLFPGDAPGEMYDYLDKEHQKFVENVDILLAPHHGSEGCRNSLWYSSHNRFCTIISGDPSFKGWGIPGPANYGIRGWSRTRLRRKRFIYYSNVRKDKAFSKEDSWWPVLCTWDERKKLVGYHIEVTGSRGKKKKSEIKLFEILSRNVGNQENYYEVEIEIEELPKRRK